MRVIRSGKFTAEEAWGAMSIANMNGITTKLHWTDKPYKWHINEGEEVFVVLNGMVEMHFKEQGAEKSVMLQAGDIFYASEGTEHVAEPFGEARVLVIETDGTV